MHKLLARQIRRQFGSESNAPAELKGFIDAIDDAYRQFDDDRALLEHSIEAVSGEMIDRYRQLQDALDASERAKGELNEALSLVEATLESTTDGLLVVDTNGAMVRMNRKFRELWSIPDEIVAARDGARALEVVVLDLEEPDAFRRRVVELMADPETDSFEIVRFKDHRVYEWYSKPQRVNGVTVGRVSSFRDVTARLSLEEQLRQSQKMEAIGSLAGGVAHDFNNLLTVISGHVQFLQADLAGSAQYGDDLAEVLHAANRAAALTRQLLAFSRRQILQPVVLDLNQVILGVEPMLRRLIGEDIQLNAVLDASLHNVVADRGQVEQVLMNLVVNARDAMPRGGSLEIGTTNIAIGISNPAETGQLDPGPYVHLSVRDTGVGIREDLLERVFEPFFTTKAPDKGTGLGLATVYGIVTQSGGHIRVESIEGRGTTFHIILPATNAQTIADVVVADESPRSTAHESILLVEDESAVRRFVARALEERGYSVVAVRSGAEALALALSPDAQVDLVLTDIVMPEMGGLELVERLRTARPRTPVIFMSGYTQDEIIRRGQPQPDTIVLQKPFTANQLARTVREALQRVLGARGVAS